jgi:hypothetical protein
MNVKKMSNGGGLLMATNKQIATVSMVAISSYRAVALLSNGD